MAVNHLPVFICPRVLCLILAELYCICSMVCLGDGRHGQTASEARPQARPRINHNSRSCCRLCAWSASPTHLRHIHEVAVHIYAGTRAAECEEPHVYRSTG